MMSWPGSSSLFPRLEGLGLEQVTRLTHRWQWMKRALGAGSLPAVSSPSEAEDRLVPPAGLFPQLCEGSRQQGDGFLADLEH